MTTIGIVTEYSTGIAPTAGPRAIITGSDGALWFTAYQGAKIGRITTAGKISNYSGLAANSGPFDITTGPNGRLWFTEISANQVGRILVP
ncbi:MAG: hypothetical protein ABI282_06210 [Candidatus Baltobacteraceae bacterium]